MRNQTGIDLPAQITKPRTTSFVREFFTSNFWISGLAILKYVPRLFRVKQVDGMAFFTEAKRDELRNRVLRITAANPRQWGTMTVPQMLHHLNLACGGSLSASTHFQMRAIPYREPCFVGFWSTGYPSSL
jgi:hypothetical protein